MSLLQDLFEIKQAGANTQFEEMTKTFETGVDTLLKHQLNSKMLDYDIANKKITQDRLDRSDSRQTFQSTMASYDNPIPKYEWLSSDEAEKLAISSGAYTVESYHDLKVNASDEADLYRDVTKFSNAFKKADFKTRTTDYDYSDIQAMISKAELSGDPGLVRSVKADETAFKYDITKKHGMGSANLIADWLEENKYLEPDDAINFRKAINAGNYIGPEKQMLQIASTKLKQDSDIMQLYRMQYNVLKDLESTGAITPDELSTRIGNLDSQYDAHFKGIITRGLPKGDEEDQTVLTSTPGLPLSYQDQNAYSFGQELDQGDGIALSQSFRGLPVNMNDVNAITLSPGGKIYADIGQGTQMYDADMLRKMAIQKPGNITFSNNEEQKKKAYAPFVINQSRDRDVVSPKVQLPLWNREAVTSANLASFSEKNIVYKDLKGGAPVMNIKSGKRGNVINFASGDPETVPMEYRGGVGMLGQSPQRKIYKSDKAKITVQLTYEEGDKIPQGSKLGEPYMVTMSMDEFIKRYAAPLYQLPSATNRVNVNDPYAGLDNSILNLGKE